MVELLQPMEMKWNVQEAVRRVEVEEGNDDSTGGVEACDPHVVTDVHVGDAEVVVDTYTESLPPEVLVGDDAVLAVLVVAEDMDKTPLQESVVGTLDVDDDRMAALDDVRRWLGGTVRWAIETEA